jgi:hypothetical protein
MTVAEGRQRNTCSQSKTLASVRITSSQQKPACTTGNGKPTVGARRKTTSTG